jgi:hypothetical protein
MTTKMTLLGLGSLILASAGAFGLAAAKPDRADCPGKITCPLTGEVICRDECSGLDPTRPDCPGRIECPETGELVCVDRCPASAKKSAGTPSCCPNRE